jgi:hypothetical protein
MDRLAMITKYGHIRGGRVRVKEQSTTGDTNLDVLKESLLDLTSKKRVKKPKYIKF